ncbi:MAG: hypothetical protein AVDCRST_MAG49-2780 [uncultured Thermomicrobiales bacterium]|uniref:Metallo-beta-lactamase domain-containing protein n=1 Tax=uncultured Thermomicrobiales bacterium TaxID=1645740 RepID=A0A6J4V3S1_9BACT|nr:MAG: hypothetical protein AVDCRST_MAG49-2780 [uncultured Thermomicrobiales bacterium]
MGLTIQTFAAGPLETNAYLVGDDVAGEAIIVDAPADVTPRIVAAAADAGLRVTRVVITHGHWDHIADAAALAAATGVEFATHPLAVERMARPSADLPVPVTPLEPGGRLDEGDEVRVGDHAFRVMHLPGHDPAHVVLYGEADRVILGGDVLFPGGHGRTDIPGSDQAAMDRSLARLAVLPPDVTVYPGHGDPTTIGAEASWLQEKR